MEKCAPGIFRGGQVKDESHTANVSSAPPQRNGNFIKQSRFPPRSVQPELTHFSHKGEIRSTLSGLTWWHRFVFPLLFAPVLGVWRRSQRREGRAGRRHAGGDGARRQPRPEPHPGGHAEAREHGGLRAAALRAPRVRLSDAETTKTQRKNNRDDDFFIYFFFVSMGALFHDGRRLPVSDGLWVMRSGSNVAIVCFS